MRGSRLQPSQSFVEIDSLKEQEQPLILRNRTSDTLRQGVMCSHKTSVAGAQGVTPPPCGKLSDPGMCPPGSTVLVFTPSPHWDSWRTQTESNQLFLHLSYMVFDREEVLSKPSCNKCVCKLRFPKTTCVHQA